MNWFSVLGRCAHARAALENARASVSKAAGMEERKFKERPFYDEQISLCQQFTLRGIAPITPEHASNVVDHSV